MNDLSTVGSGILSFPGSTKERQEITSESLGETLTELKQDGWNQFSHTGPYPNYTPEAIIQCLDQGRPYPESDGETQEFWFNRPGQ